MPFPALLAGSQAHQLHPAFLRFDPELSRGFPFRLRRLRDADVSFHPRAVKEHGKLRTSTPERQEIFFGKLLMVNCL
jgi:hypothetical protein